MAIKSKEDILNSLKERFGEDTSDETLAFIEDVTDTFADFEAKSKDSTDWKAKYEDNDKAWREKYRDRFFNSNTEDEDKEFEQDKEDKPLTFEELFQYEK